MVRLSQLIGPLTLAAEVVQGILHTTPRSPGLRDVVSEFGMNDTVYIYSVHSNRLLQEGLPDAI